MAHVSWAVLLERAEKRGHFTGRERDWACQWTSCAIGEKHGFPRKEEYVDDIPWERWEKEQDLGIEFMYAVRSDHLGDARRIFNEIQALPS
jgi:hypothetical protein